MANKRTRQLRNEIIKATRRGEPEVSRNNPVGNYHSCQGRWPEGFHTKQSFPTAVRGKDGVVSASPRRNMRMRVLQNTNEDGSRWSQTVHEPIKKGDGVRYKGHKYIKYEQPRADFSRPCAMAA